LSGYDEVGIEVWDRILMDNPKRWLVGKHKVLNYDSDAKTFTLPFDLSDVETVTYARNICEKAALTWIRKKTESGDLEESEVLRHYRSLELAKQGEKYLVADREDDDTEEFSMRAAVSHLRERFPSESIAQQPHSTPGFDVLVGKAENPIAYVKVKGTCKYIPIFTLSEGDRIFSIENCDKYLLIVIYAINFKNETYKTKIHKGSIKADSFVMAPIKWQISC